MLVSLFKKGTPSPQGNNVGKAIAQVPGSNMLRGVSREGTTNFCGLTSNICPCACRSVSTPCAATVWTWRMRRRTPRSCAPSRPSRFAPSICAAPTPRSLLARLRTTSSASVSYCRGFRRHRSSTSRQTRNQRFSSSEVSFRPTMLEIR